MDPAQIKRLKEEHEKGLQQCQEKIKSWEKFKDDYGALKGRLETLPDRLSYDITIPFGNNAFTMGQIVHTNEVMVLLGENWFAEVSAKEAAAIANRRILQCTSMLEDLNKEERNFEHWLNYIEEVGEADNLVEIVENYDEQEEKNWREQHARNVKVYRRKMAEEKMMNEQENGISNSDEDVFSKLDNLELKETESDQKELESDRSTIDCSDDGSLHSEEQACKSPLKLYINSNNYTKTFSESETGDDNEDNSKKKDLNANIQDSNAITAGKHVRWQDLSRQNIKKITFRHSKNKTKPNTQSRHQDSSEREDQPQIQSPSDIYKYFGSFFQSSPPKSILKVKSPSSDLNEPFFPTKESVPKDSSPELNDESIERAFTGKIREHSSPVHIVQNKSARPASHFRNSRKNRKR